MSALNTGRAIVLRMKRTAAVAKKGIEPALEVAAHCVERCLDPLGLLLGIERELAVGFGPGNGFLGFDDRDRVGRAVGDLGDLGSLGLFGIEDRIVAGEAAIERHDRVRLALPSGTENVAGMRAIRALLCGLSQGSSWWNS